MATTDWNYPDKFFVSNFPIVLNQRQRIFTCLVANVVILYFYIDLSIFAHSFRCFCCWLCVRLLRVHFAVYCSAIKQWKQYLHFLCEFAFFSWVFIWFLITILLTASAQCTHSVCVHHTMLLCECDLSIKCENAAALFNETCLTSTSTRAHTHSLKNDTKSWGIVKWDGMSDKKI